MLVTSALPRELLDVGTEVGQCDAAPDLVCTFDF